MEWMRLLEIDQKRGEMEVWDPLGFFYSLVGTTSPA